VVKPPRIAIFHSYIENDRHGNPKEEEETATRYIRHLPLFQTLQHALASDVVVSTIAEGITFFGRDVPIISNRSELRILLHITEAALYLISKGLTSASSRR
jgi:hypothetical protein